MPAGGYIPPDGRTPRAKGVGKNAKRHDLERPATPGITGTDLQYGEAKMLENGQKVAPRAGAKRQVNASGQKAAPKQRRSAAPAGMAAAPDPLEMLAARKGGRRIGDDVPGGPRLDVEKWSPLLREIARNPQVSGPLTTTIMQQLSNIARQPNSSSVTILDQNAAEVALEESL